MPTDESHQKLFEELKNRITVKYEIDTERYTGSVRGTLETNTEEKKRLLEEPEISELLRQIVQLDPDAGDQVAKGTPFEHLMVKVLEAAIHQLVDESEGLGKPE